MDELRTVFRFFILMAVGTLMIAHVLAGIGDSWFDDRLPDPLIWLWQTGCALPSSCSASLSPTQMMAVRPAAWAAAALAAIRASGSLWSCRRSEWPTMT